MDSWSNNIIDKEDQTNFLNVEINRVHDNLCKKFVQSYSKSCTQLWIHIP